MEYKPRYDHINSRFKICVSKEKNQLRHNHKKDTQLGVCGSKEINHNTDEGILKQAGQPRASGTLGVGLGSPTDISPIGTVSRAGSEAADVAGSAEAKVVLDPGTTVSAAHVLQSSSQFAAI